MTKYLEKTFEAKLTRYNQGDSFVSYNQSFKTTPTTDELMEFLEGINRLNSRDKDYQTDITVIERYKVVNK